MPIIQPTPIDQLPQPPNPADRSSFNSLAYPFTAAMLPMTVQINKAISDMYNNALEVEAKAAAAGSSATAAAGSATAANTARTGAETARTGAETARAGAQSSATAAANSATAANTAKTGAEAARDAAAQSATDAAQSAQDAAGIVQGNFGLAIHAVTAKSKPADADELAVADSQASWSLRKLTWSNLKAAIWAAFKAIATGGNAKDALGLGTAATRDVGTETGQLITSNVFFNALANAGSLASASATYEYDAQGRADKIVTPQGNTVIGYNPDGTVETISYPTGRVETFTYDASGNVAAMTAVGG